MTTSALDQVEARLTATSVPTNVAALVRAAFAGQRAIDRLLAEGEVADAPAASAATTPAGAYVTRLTVEGFRGIGAAATLEVLPGPGLTLVIGRNGSGKSSFAEALEVLLTGDNQRWARRSAVWREGWENLHHRGARRIEASLAVEGWPGETIVAREWASGADLDDGDAAVQPHGRPRAKLASLGWDDALSMHRPFLSYSELGSMLDEGPTKLHDAVASVLGLDDLAAAEKALRDARLAREKARKAVLADRDEVCRLLESVEDERARRAVAALRVKEPALDIVEEVVAATASGSDDGAVSRLRRAAAVEFPSAERIDAIASELRGAQVELDDLAGTQTHQLLRSAELLERALEFHDATAATTCPVCETPDVLTSEWAARARSQAEDQRAGARAFESATKRRAKADSAARALLTPVPAAVNDVRDILDVSALIGAWGAWLELKDVADAAVLAGELGPRAQAVRVALAAFVGAAEREVARREDQWRPVALALAAWLATARDVEVRASAVPDLKKAETWLKDAGVGIRNERFAPIADEALAIWKLLRQNSNVELGRIEFEGAGVKRKISLDVTVDGVDGAALGVMSQGELHSLALSLFFPRATLDESPFRFVVVDDPVQSMDPSKVDGLARVLERAAKTRQVIVFTHDDRLYEAIRRLGINATIAEVTRGEGSVVEVREALTPVERHLEDARALIRTADLPADVARRVVPSFCRMAIEAGAIEAIRRRRIGRGEPHVEVEELLGRVTRLTVFLSLALFDEANKGGDVLGAVAAQYGGKAASALKAVNAGAHEPIGYDLRDLVRDSGILAREVATRA